MYLATTPVGKMARGKYLSLEEARNAGTLDRFAKEHLSEGDADVFAALANAMISGKRKGKPRPRADADDGQTTPSDAGTSGAGPCED